MRLVWRPVTGPWPVPPQDMYDECNEELSRMVRLTLLLIRPLVMFKKKCWSWYRIKEIINSRCPCYKSSLILTFGTFFEVPGWPALLRSFAIIWIFYLKSERKRFCVRYSSHVVSHFIVVLKHPYSSFSFVQEYLLASCCRTLYHICLFYLLSFCFQVSSKLLNNATVCLVYDVIYQICGYILFQERNA